MLLLYLLPGRLGFRARQGLLGIELGSMPVVLWIRAANRRTPCSPRPDGAGTPHSKVPPCSFHRRAP